MSQIRLLEAYDDLGGTGWNWQSLDSLSVKASLGGPDGQVQTLQTDERWGQSLNLLTDQYGVPSSVVITAANTHDMKAATETLDRTVVERP